MKLMRMPTKALLIGLSAAILLGGCKPKPPSGIKFVPQVHTVASLCPSAAELLSLGNPKIVGISTHTNFPATLKNIDFVADVKPDYEKLAALKPDVIVYDPAVYNANDIAKLKQLKSTLVPIEGDTVEEFVKSVYRLGQAIQSETSLLDYIYRLEQEVNVCRANPLTPAPKTAIVMADPTTAPRVAGTKSFYCDLVRVAGGEPVGPATNDFSTMNPEALLALNPDVIILPLGKGEDTNFMSDPRFAQLKAVKTQHVRIMDADYLLRRGERADEALKQLHDMFIKLK